MAHATSSSPSSSVKDSSRPAAAPPDARASRDPSGHSTQAFRLATVRYAAPSGKSQRAAARDMGISDKTLYDWARDARPDPVTGVVDVARFDELAELQARNRALLAQTARLTGERDFLKKCEGYFASPAATGGSK